MRTTLSHTAQITLDLHIRQVVSRLLSGRQFGSAEVWVPRVSAAHSTSYISAERTQVEIDLGVLGLWQGIVTEVATDREGSTLTAQEIGYWTATQAVGVNATYRNCTAGTIAYHAVLDAAGGVARSPVRPGVFLEAPPLIASYEFRGQPLSQVLADLMEASGQEWRIKNGALDWIPPAGTLYEPLLASEGDVLDDAMSVRGGDLLSSLTGRDAAGRTWSADAPENIGIGARREVINISTTTPLRLAVETRAALTRRRLAERIYTCRLRDLSGHWGIRPGDVVRLHLPNAGPAGASPVCRVLSWTYREGESLLDIELYELRPFTSEMPLSVATDQITALPHSGEIEMLRQALGGNGIALVKECIASEHLMPRAVRAEAIAWHAVEDEHIVDMAASKLTGNLATVRMQVNAVAAVTASTGRIDAARMANGGAQSDSAAWTDTTAQTDFNALMAKLRAAGVIS